MGIAIADLLFLSVAGAAVAWTMHAAHMLEVGFCIEMVAGMAATMLAQLALAWLAAPILGSIETMTPSMILAMLAPMLICVVHACGSEPRVIFVIAYGVGAGVVAFVLLAAYGMACRRWATTLGTSAKARGL